MDIPREHRWRIVAPEFRLGWNIITAHEASVLADGSLVLFSFEPERVLKLALAPGQWLTCSDADSEITKVMLTQYEMDLWTEAMDQQPANDIQVACLKSEG